MQSLKEKTKGFTIIEVMIVLVIAAVIILIVFLAVPALQRNSRNNQLRNDVGKVLAGVTEFSNNNNGQMPTGVATNGTTVSISGPTGTTPVDVSIQQGHTFSASTSMPAATSTGTVSIALNRKCNTTNNGIDGANTSRSVAAGFNVEASGNPVPQCQAS